MDRGALEPIWSQGPIWCQVSGDHTASLTQPRRVQATSCSDRVIDIPGLFRQAGALPTAGGRATRSRSRMMRAKSFPRGPPPRSSPGHPGCARLANPVPNALRRGFKLAPQLFRCPALPDELDDALPELRRVRSMALPHRGPAPSCPTMGCPRSRGNSKFTLSTAWWAVTGRRTAAWLGTMWSQARRRS